MLIKTWFIFISGILLSSLLILIFNFNTINPFHWIYLGMLMIAILLHILVYLERPHKTQPENLKAIYAQLLRQKDRQIEELKNKERVLFNTAMKRTEKDIELNEIKRKLEEKN